MIFADTVRFPSFFFYSKSSKFLSFGERKRLIPHVQGMYMREDNALVRYSYLFIIRREVEHKNIIIDSMFFLYIYPTQWYGCFENPIVWARGFPFSSMVLCLTYDFIILFSCFSTYNAWNAENKTFTPRFQCQRCLELFHFQTDGWIN